MNYNNDNVGKNIHHDNILMNIKMKIIKIVIFSVQLQYDNDNGHNDTK